MWKMCRQIFLLFAIVIHVVFGFELVQTENIFENYLNEWQSNDVNENILQDSLLTAPQLIAKYGYPIEVYSVETEDGYILEMHRIPRPGARPVLLMHGLLDSSSTWVLMGPDKGLGYMLYQLGYDVWMGNARGNRYSRKHKSYAPKNSKFWDFSFHEIGKYDLPVLIDTVLNKTDHKKLHYIAHSQGSIVFWIMCSERPEYNDKITSVQAMGPVAFLKYCRSPVVIFLKSFINSFKVLYRLIGMNEFLPNTELLNLFGNLFCKDESIVQPLCRNIIFFVVGFNKDQMNSTMLPVVLGHTPAGASSKQIVHFLQLKKHGEFLQYDYGFFKNMIKYGSIKPPKYDLSKVKVKVALHYSLNDWMSEPRDVDRLHRLLPNSIGKFLVKDKKFNHLDFVWGINAREYLFEKMVTIIKNVEREEIEN